MTHNTGSTHTPAELSAGDVSPEWCDLRLTCSNLSFIQLLINWLSFQSADESLINRMCSFSNEIIHWTSSNCCRRKSEAKTTTKWISQKIHTETWKSRLTPGCFQGVSRVFPGRWRSKCTCWRYWSRTTADQQVAASSPSLTPMMKTHLRWRVVLLLSPLCCSFLLVLLPPPSAPLPVRAAADLQFNSTHEEEFGG